MKRNKRNRTAAVTALVLAGILTAAPGTKAVPWTEAMPVLAAERKSSDGMKSQTIRGLEPFTSIDVSVELSDVTFLPSQDYGLEMVWADDQIKPDYEIKNGKLSVFTHQHGSLKLHGASTGRLVVYLPETADLKAVSVRTDMGNIQIADRNMKSLEVYCSLGDILVNRVSVQDIDATVNLGDLMILDSSVEKSAEAECDAGDILISGNIRGTVHITDDLGDIRFDAADAAEKFRYDLSVDLGKVFVDGTESGKYGTRKTGGYELQAQTEAGDLEVNFASDKAMDAEKARADGSYREYAPYGITYVTSRKALYYDGKPVQGFAGRRDSKGSSDRYYDSDAESGLFLSAKYENGVLAGIEEMKEAEVKEAFGSGKR